MLTRERNRHGAWRKAACGSSREELLASPQARRTGACKLAQAYSVLELLELGLCCTSHPIFQLELHLVIYALRHLCGRGQGRLQPLHKTFRLWWPNGSAHVMRSHGVKSGRFSLLRCRRPRSMSSRALRSRMCNEGLGHAFCARFHSQVPNRHSHGVILSICEVRDLHPAACGSGESMAVSQAAPQQC